MGQVTIKHVEELGYYSGEHAIEGIKFRYAAKELGVSAWGMNVLELAPQCTRYPEHDHQGDGQEEVYVILRGSARLRLGSDERRLGAGALVRVPPDQRRAWLTDDEGALILAIGATPGQAYAPKK
jgi:quercetin dioxygenase-like cupin family protein